MRISGTEHQWWKRVRAALVLVSSIVLMVGGQPSAARDDSKADAAKSDLRNLQGTWKPTALWRADGSQWPEEILKISMTEIKGDQLILSREGRAQVSYTVRLDPSRKPKAIDLSVNSDGPLKGQVKLGIYELEGDTLKIAVQQGTRPGRPKGFEKGKGCTVSIYKRVEARP